mmetsp:Transcript_12845/g.38247  ORF Transcript_12845/g.38247 Transcript_12845/m.38247 type:complete len:142 (-) Transcript_12845:48-473(-)
MKLIIALLATYASAFSTSRGPLPAAHRRASTVAPRMMDAAVLQGGAAAVGGLVFGVGAIWFSEQQIERGEARGSDVVSATSRAKMSAMFMEDEAMPDDQLDDTVARMEAAMARAKGEVLEEVEEAEVKTDRGGRVINDDGW